MDVERINYLRNRSDQAIEPAQMLPVNFPEGTILCDELENGFGAVELLHGRIWTFEGKPNEYADGSIIIFRDGPSYIQAYLTRRGLTGDDINQVGILAKAIINTTEQQYGMQKDPLERGDNGLKLKKQELVKEADGMGITLISAPVFGSYLPVKLAAKNLQENTDNATNEADELKHLLQERMDTLDKVTGTQFSKYPFLEALRSRFNWKNLQEILFGGNAYPGHAIAAALGMCPGIADFYLQLKSEPTVLTLAPVAVLVASLLIPYQGYDRLREKWQADVITYGPMFTLGTTAGGLIATRLLEHMQNIAGVAETPSTLLTTANASGMIGAAAVLMAYITVGFMSRRERWEYLSRFNLPESVNRIDTVLLMRKDHMRADRLHRAIGTSDIESAIAFFEELKENAYEEPEMSLDEIKTRITVDKLQGILKSAGRQKIGLRETLATLGELRGRIDRLPQALTDKKKRMVLGKTLDMIATLRQTMTNEEIREKIILGEGSINRSSGVPLWLLELAEDELLDWHYNHQEQENARPKPKTGRRRSFYRS